MNMNSTTPTNLRRGVPLWMQILVWIFLVGFLFLIGLGVTRARQGHVQSGKEIPDFTLSLYSGYEYNGQGVINLSDLRGKVVFINFWASWCIPCAQEAPVLEKAWRYYQPDGRVVFLGVDYVDTELEARVFLKRFGNTYPNGPDIGTRISQAFRISGVPETYVIDSTGILNYVKIGPFLSVDEIRAVVDPLLP